MRFFRVSFIAAIGLLGGAVAGFIAAALFHPNATSDYSRLGSIAGMVTLLWLTGSFGRFVWTYISGALGAGLGWIIGWILGRFVFGTGGGVAFGGMIIGAILFTLRPPFSGQRSSKLRDHNLRDGN